MMRERGLAVWCPLVFVVFTCGCGPRDSSLSSPARAPLAGKTDASDRSDRSCQVVLRSVGRQPGGNDYETQCSGAACNYVWRGTVDVADTVKGTVRVLYRLAADAAWWQVDATLATQSQPGFTRYEFAISEHLFGPSGVAAAIELLPYVELADGSRLFDHNSRPGDLQNYELDASNSFALGDSGVCAPVAGQVTFFGDWTQQLYGALRQNGYLVINYVLPRLPACRGTHNGAPAWDIVAHARFQPSGAELSGSVREFDSEYGMTKTTAHSKNLVLQIPADATSVEIWFENYTGAGSSCHTWDSNYGKNYSFEVWPPASDPRCLNIEQWSTVNSDMPYATTPYCLGYTVVKNLDADCEFYPSGMGDGFMGHYGFPNHWVESYLDLGTVPGQLLGVGMFTRYRDASTGAVSERFTMGRQFAPSTWQTGFIYYKPTIMQPGFQYEIQQLAFFLDVRQAGGDVVRLWHSRQGANYTWNDAFTLPTTQSWIPYGNIKYASPDSSMFETKRTCGK